MPLVLTMMLAVVLAAMGSAMTITSATESIIAGAHREGTALFYAADAAVEFALEELATSDWRQVLDSGESSTFVDATPPDSEALAGPTGYEVYAYGRFGDLLGRPPAALDPYIVVWVADLAGTGDGTGTGRIAGIWATALAPAGVRRSIALTARLSSADEEVDEYGDAGTTVERLSWTQDP